MTQDIIDLANQASKEWLKEYPTPEETANLVPKRYLEIFAKLVAAKTEAQYMQLFLDPENQPTQFGTATQEYREKEIKEEREACAKVCEEAQTYSMPISCPDGISGCLVAHYIPARREKTGSEAAAAIRARGEA